MAATGLYKGTKGLQLRGNSEPFQLNYNMSALPVPLILPGVQREAV